MSIFIHAEDLPFIELAVSFLLSITGLIAEFDHVLEWSHINLLQRELYFKTNFVTLLHSPCSSEELKTRPIRWPLRENVWNAY